MESKNSEEDLISKAGGPRSIFSQTTARYKPEIVDLAKNYAGMVAGLTRGAGGGAGIFLRDIEKAFSDFKKRALK